MSYGASIKGAYRQAGTYVGRVLKGEKLADPPVVQPTRLELVINLKSAGGARSDCSPASARNRDDVIE
jgi:putative tryptophan/tyrosine transport system substrate-binding protein